MTYPHTPHSTTVNMYCMYPACLPLTPLIVAYHIAIPLPSVRAPSPATVLYYSPHTLHLSNSPKPLNAFIDLLLPYVL